MKNLFAHTNIGWKTNIHGPRLQTGPWISYQFKILIIIFMSMHKVMYCNYPYHSLAYCNMPVNLLTSTSLFMGTLGITLIGVLSPWHMRAPLVTPVVTYLLFSSHQYSLFSILVKNCHNTHTVTTYMYMCLCSLCCTQPVVMLGEEQLHNGN